MRIDDDNARYMDFHDELGMCVHGIHENISNIATTVNSLFVTSFLF